MKTSHSIYIIFLFSVLASCNRNATSNETEKINAAAVMPQAQEKDRHPPASDGHIHPGTKIDMKDTGGSRPLTGTFAIIEKHGSQDVIKEILPFINTNRIRIRPDDILKPGKHGHFEYEIIELNALDGSGNPIPGKVVRVAVELDRVILKDTTVTHVH